MRSNNAGNRAVSLRSPISLDPALAIFGACVSFFALLILDGYALALGGLASSPSVIFLILLLESAACVLWLSRQALRFDNRLLEFAGFLFVVLVTWFYVLYPSLPSLIPPSYSGDAANHVALIDRIFVTGRIFSDYPGGPALVVATIAHWINVLPVRLLHPIASFWIALSAGGIYLIACYTLPSHRYRAISALFASFALYLPSIYFIGILVGPQYFMTQVAAQFFLIAFVAFLLRFLATRHLAWGLAMGSCLISIIVSFPLWLLLPLCVAGLTFLWEWLRRRISLARVLKASLAVLGPPFLFLSAVFLTGGTYISTTSRLTEPGSSIPATPQAFGILFLALAVAGLFLLPSSSPRASVLALFLLGSIAQTAVLSSGKPLFGWADYWINKSYNIWIYPLALSAAIPFDWLVRKATSRLATLRVSPAAALGTACLAAATFAGITLPGAYSPISESDLQSALWVKDHLETTHVNYIGAANLTAQWLVALWDEHLPSDLYISLPSLGPKTYEAWRDDPDWGQYLFVSDRQNLPLGAELTTVFQNGNSRIVKRPQTPVLETGATLGRFADVLGLVDYELTDQTYRAGQSIAVSGHLETLAIPTSHVVWRLQLRDLAGNSIAESRSEVFGNKFTLERWPTHVVLPDAWKIDLPSYIEPGLYNLQLGLYSVGTGEPQVYTDADGTNDVVHLGRVKIGFPPSVIRDLGTSRLTNIQVGDAIRLLGYRSSASSLKPGDTLRVSLFWQALGPVGQDYTVFVHILDSRGNLFLQKDSPPRNGAYPTSAWESREIIADAYSIDIPMNAAPGDYTIEIGMYRWPALKRLPTLLDRGAISDRILLPTKVTISR